MEDRFIGILQARMGSSRLPGKSLMELYGFPLLELILHRLKNLNVERLWIATTHLEEDDVIANLGERLGLPVLRGDSRDVLSRFLSILDLNPAEWVIRFTGDNPLIHHETSNLLIEAARDALDVDYISDFVSNRYPIGALPEAVKSERLYKLSEISMPSHHRSHVTSHIWQSGLRTSPIKLPGRYREHPEWRWTLDEPSDLKFFQEVGEQFGAKVIDAGFVELSNFLEGRPEIVRINQDVKQKNISEG
jgi:spore coat polysaccharide biosynthesis protein SpsF